AGTGGGRLGGGLGVGATGHPREAGEREASGQTEGGTEEETSAAEAGARVVGGHERTRGQGERAGRGREMIKQPEGESQDVKRSKGRPPGHPSLRSADCLC